MHGRGLGLLGGLLLLASAGCTDDTLPPDPPPRGSAPGSASASNPTVSGTITGQVRWLGTLPQVSSFKVLPDPENPPPDGKRMFVVPNPYSPTITAEGCIADAIVFLRGVAGPRARPWPHGSVRVEQRDRRLNVVQDGHASRVGIVRCGDEFEAVNCDREYHSLRVRGAAFFTLPFVEADQLTRRRLEQAGIVELMSGASHYWMHAKLLVVDHAYYARTSADGKFRLEQVPVGRYELVGWLPSWEVLRKERDPESALISRLVFAPALEQVRTVEVRAAETSEVKFELSGKR